jgi:exodeoxyribonuclease-3
LANFAPQGVFDDGPKSRIAFRRRNLGLRIDLSLASTALAADCVASVIDREPRGWEKPSDHAPVVTRFADLKS